MVKVRVGTRSWVLCVCARDQGGVSEQGGYVGSGLPWTDTHEEQCARDDQEPEVIRFPPSERTLF